ncbi:MAG: glycosyltransferase family 2 protein [Deltaproteobacteria bacterium]|jgi:glycosyltransferase involved in cell wall biosynthesis|nr:glycosyltransferase family 2 protein [Deltaproteobacteria bacterium]
MTEAKVSVVIPAFNESENIGDLIQTILQRYPDFEVVVIDDGSEDNTAEVAADSGAIVYSHPYNIGNGAAIKSGIRAATGEIFVFMDGDGQHNPEDIAKLLEHMPEFDMVVGARVKGSQASVGRGIGNRIYNWLGSYVSKFAIQDLTSGFRAVKADVARSFVYLLPNTYSYPTTITLGILRTGRSVKYVPITVQPRRKGSSNIKLFHDGVRFFMMIIRICTLYSPMRVFLPVSFIMFLLGSFRYLHSYITEGRFTNMSALLYVASIIIFMMSLISEQVCQLRFERRERKISVKRCTPQGK